MQPLAAVNIAANRRRSIMSGPILPAFSKLSQLLHQTRASAAGSDPPMDTAVFRLSYRLTARLLLLFAFVATTQSLVGEQIECTASGSVPRPVINSYCLVAAVYSLQPQQPRAVSDREWLGRATADSAGLGSPGHRSTDASNRNAWSRQVRQHVFYQWVPFVLAFQALLFYAPHSVWKQRSGPVMRHCFAFQLDQPDASLHGSSTKLISFASYLTARMGRTNQHLFSVYFFCELLCMLNVLANVFLLDLYVGGHLPAYCINQLVTFFGGEDTNFLAHNIPNIFPNIAKCSFGKFGASGTLEHLDALCVLPHNVFYRRMFTFLWLWFVTLSVINILHCIYRLTSMLVPKVRRTIFFCLLLEEFLEYGRLVFERCTVYDWFLLCSLGRRMDTLAFSELVRHLATGGGQDLLLPNPPALGSRRASQWSERRPTDRQTSIIAENINKLTHV